MGKREHTEAVRVVKCAIGDIHGADRKETLREWFNLAEQATQATNTVWQMWEVWHVQNRSAEKIRAWLAEPKVNGKRATKCPVECMPKELSKLIYERMGEDFPGLHNRTRELIRNRTQSLIGQRKASRGSLPGWTAILLCNEGRPGHTHLVGLPFDKANSEILLSADPAKKPHGIRLRLDRYPKENGKGFASGTYEFDLAPAKWRDKGRDQIVSRIATGEWVPCGSTLQYDRHDRRWYVLLAYKRPCKSRVEGKATAVLRAGRKGCWRLRVTFENGRCRTFRLGGDGRIVGVTRQKLLTQRWSRREKYRVAPTSANKGHGRERAYDFVGKLSTAWRNFVRSHNHETSAKVMRICEEHGVATLLYVQPDGSRGRSRMLVTAGKDHEMGTFDSTAWEFHQIGAMLSQKAQERGIFVTVKKSERKERAEVTAGQV